MDDFITGPLPPETPDAYKARLSGLTASHVTVEVHACRHSQGRETRQAS